MPWAWAIAETAAMSVSFSVGLAGVSVKISRVLSLIAATTFYGFDVSTKSYSTPNLLYTWVASR